MWTVTLFPGTSHVTRAYGRVTERYFHSNFAVPGETLIPELYAARTWTAAPMTTFISESETLVNTPN